MSQLIFFSPRLHSRPNYPTFSNGNQFSSQSSEKPKSNTIISHYENDFNALDTSVFLTIKDTQNRNQNKNKNKEINKNN